MGSVWHGHRYSELGAKIPKGALRLAEIERMMMVIVIVMIMVGIMVAMVGMVGMIWR